MCICFYRRSKGSNFDPAFFNDEKSISLLKFKKKTSVVVKVVQFKVYRKLPETSGSVVHTLVEMLPK